MILELDAGNTFIKWRLLDRNQVCERGKFLTASDEWIWPACCNHLTEVRVASVAGKDVNNRLIDQIKKLSACVPEFACTVGSVAGVVNSYSDPSRMGVDRWLAMLAAYSECKRACCIVDCGSAITVDYLSGDGQHLGGYIIPGLRLLNAALLQNTAEVIVDQDIKAFDLSPGKNTSTAVTHGVNYLFDSLCQKICSELEVQSEPCALYITGGDGALFHQLAGQGKFVPDLVMDGLQWSLG